MSASLALSPSASPRLDRSRSTSVSSAASTASSRSARSSASHSGSAPHSARSSSAASARPASGTSRSPSAAARPESAFRMSLADERRRRANIRARPVHLEIAKASYVRALRRSRSTTASPVAVKAGAAPRVPSDDMQPDEEPLVATDDEAVLVPSKRKAMLLPDFLPPPSVARATMVALKADRPAPFFLHSDRFLAAIARHIRLPSDSGFADVSISSLQELLRSTYTAQLVDRMFWYSHTLLFIGIRDTTLEQNLLFSSIAQAYGSIFRQLGPTKDDLLQVLPYAIAKAVFNMMFYFFPQNRGQQFTREMRDTLMRLVFFMLTGLSIPDEMHRRHWQQLFPTDLPLPEHMGFHLIPADAPSAYSPGAEPLETPLDASPFVKRPPPLSMYDVDGDGDDDGFIHDDDDDDDDDNDGGDNHPLARASGRPRSGARPASGVRPASGARRAGRSPPRPVSAVSRITASSIGTWSSQAPGARQSGAAALNRPASSTGSKTTLPTLFAMTRAASAGRGRAPPSSASASRSPGTWGTSSSPDTALRPRTSGSNSGRPPSGARPVSALSRDTTFSHVARVRDSALDCELVFDASPLLHPRVEVSSKFDAFGTSPLIAHFLPDSPHVLIGRHLAVSRTSSMNSRALTIQRNLRGLFGMYREMRAENATGRAIAHYERESASLSEDIEHIRANRDKEIAKLRKRQNHLITLTLDGVGFVAQKIMERRQKMDRQRVEHHAGYDQAAAVASNVFDLVQSAAKKAVVKHYEFH